jgi:hypothetical protein
LTGPHRLTIPLVEAAAAGRPKTTPVLWCQ